MYCLTLSVFALKDFIKIFKVTVSNVHFYVEVVTNQDFFNVISWVIGHGL